MMDSELSSTRSSIFMNALNSLINDSQAFKDVTDPLPTAKMFILDNRESSFEVPVWKSELVKGGRRLKTKGREKRADALF